MKTKERQSMLMGMNQNIRKFRSDYEEGKMGEALSDLLQYSSRIRAQERIDPSKMEHLKNFSDTISHSMTFNLAVAHEREIGIKGRKEYLTKMTLNKNKIDQMVMNTTGYSKEKSDQAPIKRPTREIKVVLSGEENEKKKKKTLKNVEVQTSTHPKYQHERRDEFRNYPQSVQTNNSGKNFQSSHSNTITNNNMKLRKLNSDTQMEEESIVYPNFSKKVIEFYEPIIEKQKPKFARKYKKLPIENFMVGNTYLVIEKTEA